MEKKMFAIKVPAKKKAAMDLVARETKRTLANIYYEPLERFIHESLGAVILGKLDEIRGNVRSVEIVRLLLSNGGGAKFTPVAIKDFIEMMTTGGGGRKFKMLFPDLSFSDKSFLLHEIDLHELVETIGREYLERGGNLQTIDIELSHELFFEHMLYNYYSLSAEGSMDTLSTAWNDNYPKVTMFRDSILREYKAKYGKSLVEIFEVEPDRT